MKGIFSTLVVTFLLGMCYFGFRAWNGIETPILSNITTTVRSILNMPLETVDEEEETDANTSSSEEDTAVLEAQQEVFTARGQALAAFKTSDGKYHRARDAAELSKLATALAPFYGKNAVELGNRLKEISSDKGLPAFFILQVEVEEKEVGGIDQLVPRASVDGVLSREEAYPLPETTPTRKVIGEIPGGGEDFNNLDDFIKEYERYLPPPKTLKKGEDKFLKIRMALEGQIASDLALLQAKGSWRPVVVQTTWSYKGETADHGLAIKFLPYRLEWPVSTAKAHRKARERVANTAGINPEVLEEMVTGAIENHPGLDQVWVVYESHTDTLALEARPKESVDTAKVTNEMLLAEFDNFGGYRLNPGSEPLHMLRRMLQDLQMETLPEVFVRKIMYSKTGEHPVRMRYEHLLSAYEIRSREGVDLTIEALLDKRPETHYQFGCVQSRKELRGMFNEYAATVVEPLPCEVIFNNFEKRVISFRKVETEEASAASVTTPPVGTEFKIFRFSEIEYLKEKVGEGLAETIGSPEFYRSLVENAINQGKTNVALDGDKINGGWVLATVAESGMSFKIQHEKRRAAAHAASTSRR